GFRRLLITCSSSPISARGVRGDSARGRHALLGDRLYAHRAGRAVTLERQNQRSHVVSSRQCRVENNSSNRSPNQASNTSTSALLTGTSSGQSSVTVHSIGSTLLDRLAWRVGRRA